MLSKCPVCGEELRVVSLKCFECNTTINGNFTLNKLSRLSRDQLEFIETFIKCRGNLKEVEKEMDISYPTVRNKLDEVTASLGFSVDDSAEDTFSQKRKEILDKLENEEIDSEKAADLLKNL